MNLKKIQVLTAIMTCFFICLQAEKAMVEDKASLSLSSN